MDSKKFWKRVGNANWGDEFFNQLERERDMEKKKPLVNAWYVNLSGKLYKVRMLDYNAGELTNVLVENLEGATVLFSLKDWEKLSLKIHSWQQS